MTDSGIQIKIGFGGLLTLLLITLKLTHVIDWSWWVVLALVWIPAVGGVVVLAAVGIWSIGVLRGWW